MPLSHTTLEASDAFEIFSFLMRDGERMVRVDVHRRVLEEITGIRSRSPDRYLAAVEQRRRQLEQIASAKYDRGDYLRYANSRVVSIATADWAHSEPAAALAS